MALIKLKSMFGERISGLDETKDSSKPQIGFKLVYCEGSKQLKVKVIGARLLPNYLGSFRPEGYLIKVKVFPGRTKFETQVAKESWPTYNQEFVFNLVIPPNGTSRLQDHFTGKFVVFTAYAVMQTKNESEDLATKSRNTIKRMFSLVDKTGEEKEGKDDVRRSLRKSFNNRRTIGAVTYNLDAKVFTQKLRNNLVGTPDVWRDVEVISSGMEVQSKESKKGQLEVTMTYSTSEDGHNDLLETCLSRFRCSMKTMHEHEKLGGSLYIKMSAFHEDELITKWKSGKFEPTISMKIEPKTAILQTFFNSKDVDDVGVLIRLMCRNVLGKKTLLGRIQVNKRSSIWREAVANPSTAVTEMISLE